MTAQAQEVNGWNDGGAYRHPDLEAVRPVAVRLEGFAEVPLSAQPPPLPSYEAAAGGRLVTSKTSQGGSFIVPICPSLQAEKRVARLKRSVWASGHLHGLADTGHRPPVCWFVTLTYADAQGWRADHVSGAIERFRQWCRRSRVACRYTWVAEIQDGNRRADGVGRGAVHYHLLAWLPVGVEMPAWSRMCDRKHSRFWPHGRSETEPARAGVGYLMKYLSKLGEFHRFPKGLRLYGIGGLLPMGRAVRSWFNLPEWAKRLHGVGELCRAGSRLVVAATGELLSSPWSVRLCGGGIEFTLVGVMPDKWHDGAYSSWPCRVAA